MFCLLRNVYKQKKCVCSYEEFRYKAKQISNNTWGIVHLLCNYFMQRKVSEYNIYIHIYLNNILNSGMDTASEGV